MFGHHSDHDTPIRYFKLRNSGAAVIHFLIKDSAGGRTVWEGGPTLTIGSDDTIDLSSTPGIDSGNSFCFGAFVTGGRNAVDDHAHPVDFKTDIVGVWTWSGTTIAGSKVKFEGYERFEKKPSAEIEVERLLKKVGCVKALLEDRGLPESEMKEIEVLAREAGRGLMGVLASYDEKVAVLTKGGMPRDSKM